MNSDGKQSEIRINFESSEEEDNGEEDNETQHEPILSGISKFIIVLMN
jgi:hypothetical protein